MMVRPAFSYFSQNSPGPNSAELAKSAKLHDEVVQQFHTFRTFREIRGTQIPTRLFSIFALPKEFAGPKFREIREIGEASRCGCSAFSRFSHFSPISPDANSAESAKSAKLRDEVVQHLHAFRTFREIRRTQIPRNPWNRRNFTMR